jgi:hypothetical protein
MELQTVPEVADLFCIAWKRLWKIETEIDLFVH